MRRGFLSTPSARRATGKPDIDYSDWTISIHALREEGDVLPNFFDVKGIDFYPRPPRGGRPNLTPITALCLTFLSTPSARRATSINKCLQRIFFYFYPRPPRGGRPGVQTQTAAGLDFYPRPPRGGRQGRYDYYWPVLAFLSTPSARRATSTTRHQSPGC